MQVNRVATMIPESIQADLPVREAAMKMRDAKIGLLIVADGSNMVGVVTDRDIVTRSVAAGNCVCKSTVRDIMTQPVQCISSSALIQDAAQQMAEKSIRRLVVLNDERVPVGVLSIDDLAFSTRGDRTAAQVLESLAHGPEAGLQIR